MYEIWKYFSPETRAAVAETPYTTDIAASKIDLRFNAPRSEEGDCPLGDALLLEYNHPLSCPSGYVVAEALYDSDVIGFFDKGEVQRIANEFIQAFDLSNIKDLKEALGVEDSG